MGAGYCWVLGWEQQLGTDVDLELRPGRQFWNVTEDSKSHENVPDSAWILSQGLGVYREARPTGGPWGSCSLSIQGLGESLMNKIKSPTHEATGETQGPVKLFMLR